MSKGDKFIYEPRPIVEAREKKMWETYDRDMKDMMKETPVEVKAGTIDGRKVIETMSLGQMHILEQLAIKMITDEAILQALPTSFYKKIIKAYLIKLWDKIKPRGSREEIN